ncbi:MAG: thiol reductant ABC exporter subunit CydC [Candidatus Nanopelagicales bacterium]|nr:thiol reductant ABC exporter subunit CydC [Candidatus Nanopelagicales bacterium]MCF8551056.1 thiol reductant ABC exporter subunit CydC [Candidatus Nanopelagicales bacterium]
MSATTRLWRQVSIDKRGISSAAVIGALASLSAVALMGVSAWLIASAAEMPPVLTLTVAAVSVRFFALSRAVLRYAERLLGHNAALKGLTNLRVTVYESLERITPVGIRRFARGDFFARIGADVDGALDLPLRVVLPWAQAALVTVTTVLFTVWVLPEIGLAMAIIGVTALIGVPVLVRLVVSRSDRKLAEVRAEVTQGVLAITDNSSEILMSGVRTPALNALAQRDRVVNTELRTQAWSLGLGTGLGVALQGVAVVTALILGIPAVTSGRMAPVMLAVVAFLPLALFEILSQLPATAVAWKNMTVVAQRIDELESDSNDSAYIISALPEAAGVQAQHVDISWPGSPTSTLHDLSFSILPGDHVAIVGPSGSGKSTLAYALMGYLPWTGSLAVNPSRVMLSQQSHVFDTTVRNNIQIGGGEMSTPAIEGVIARASLTQWLANQPQGLDTELGSEGARMSGGEKQRLAFARLLAARQELLIFDEPTEHLDFETAEALEREIWDSTRGTTTVMVTHRLTAAAQCTQIMEIVAGRITAIGSHEELLQAGGWYATTWQAQESQLHMLATISQLPVGVAVTR